MLLSLTFLFLCTLSYSLLVQSMQEDVCNQVFSLSTMHMYIKVSPHLTNGISKLYSHFYILSKLPSQVHQVLQVSCTPRCRSQDKYSSFQAFVSTWSLFDSFIWLIQLHQVFTHIIDYFTVPTNVVEPFLHSTHLLPPLNNFPMWSYQSHLHCLLIVSLHSMFIYLLHFILLDIRVVGLIVVYITSFSHSYLPTDHSPYHSKDITT